ncbi:MAG: SprT family zinc-dependent metalloprotease [Clostridia bacterium]|nr:SprT family zinc-dependent metalloprotease [Clostridia bacterium]
MEEKLSELYKECLKELEDIRINTLECGNVEINISKRNNKRYGACKQLEPDETSRYIETIKRKRYIKYWRYNKHLIEISPWVMELDEKIIKNTIMHELIHCMPYCSNHGEKFKEYAKYINSKLGYDISRVRK